MSSSFRDLRREAPGFTTYFATAVMARIANEGLKLALVLAAKDSSAGLKMGGMLVAAFLIPAVIAAPFVGRLADMTSHPRRLYAIAFAFNGTIIALTGLLLGVVHPALILLMAAIGGSVGPLLQGGLSALVGSIVPKPLLSRGYAMDVVTYNVSAILAPAAVAAIAGVISPLVALLLLAVLMMCAAANVLRLPLERESDRALSASASPADGIKAIAAIPPLRSTVVVTSLATMGLGVMPIAATLLAHGRFSVNAGVLLSTMAIGSLVGSVSYAMRPFGTDHPHRMLPPIVVATAIPFALLTMTHQTWLGLLCFFLAGALGGPQGTAQFSVRDRFSPPPVRTQVFTLSTSIKTTFGAIGAAIAGFLSGSPVTVLLLFAVCSNLAGALLSSIDLHRNFSARHEEGWDADHAEIVHVGD